MASVQEGLLALCPVADRETAHRLSREMMKELAERGAGFSENGTPSVIVPDEEMGDTPIKYWSGDVWHEGARLLGTPHYNEVLHTKPLHCLHCPVGCHRHVRVDGPPEFAMEGNGPEYETIASPAASHCPCSLRRFGRATRPPQ